MRLFERNNYLPDVKELIAVLLFVLLMPAPASGQETYRPKVTRILFVLDASGSMNGQWDGMSKFEASRNLLGHIVDSLGGLPGRIETGLRIYGHQSPKADHNCKDSRLEIPFGTGNAVKIKSLLARINPQGYTPIAYSLFQAASDFPADTNSKNVIILITDGLENCDGDPCSVSPILQKQRIALKPFIVGLGVGSGGKAAFDCVGTFYDASDNRELRTAMGAVISQATNNTTVQVNLMDGAGNPVESEVEMTFYDAFSGRAMVNFVHCFTSKGLPDTVIMDPVGKYTLAVHTKIPVQKNDIELVPGRHNIIALEAPQGSLSLRINQPGESSLQALVKQKGGKDLVYVQYINSSQRYLEGEYDIEILTLPRIVLPASIRQGKETVIEVPVAGTLSITVSRPGILSIYPQSPGRMEMIFENSEVVSTAMLKLQPGAYDVVYRPARPKQAALTNVKSAVIAPGTITSIKF